MGTPRGVSILVEDVKGRGGLWAGLGMGGAWWPALVMQRALPFLHRVPKMPSASPVWPLSQTNFPAPTPRFFRTRSVDSPPVPKSEPPHLLHIARTHAHTHTHTHAPGTCPHVCTGVCRYSGMEPLLRDLGERLVNKGCSGNFSPSNPQA